MIPQPFQAGVEGAIASYDWVETSSGIGYVSYYANYIVGGTTTYAALPTPISSYPTAITIGAAAGLVIDADWDISFTRALTVEGKLYVTTTTDIDNTWQRIDLHVIHVDEAGNETQLIAASGASVDSGAAQVSIRSTVMAEVPLQVFKDGEKLRVNTKFWSKTTGTGKKLYVDGANSHPSLFIDKFAGGTVTNDTNLIIAVPYKVDI